MQKKLVILGEQAIIVTTNKRMRLKRMSSSTQLLKDEVRLYGKSCILWKYGPYGLRVLAIIIPLIHFVNSNILAVSGTASAIYYAEARRKCKVNTPKRRLGGIQTGFRKKISFTCCSIWRDTRDCWYVYSRVFIDPECHS